MQPLFSKWNCSLFNFLENLQLSLFDQKRRTIPAFLPKEIQFRTIHQKISIDYEWKRGSETRLQENNHALTISGNLNRAQVKKVINKWIATQAKRYFVPLVAHYSKQTGLKYSNLRFKNAKSRWGSCSEKKTINLNIQLLFLPEHLSTHVLIHELCHLQHLNHSKEFWKLVESFQPNYKRLEKELKTTGRNYIPGWLLRR